MERFRNITIIFLLAVVLPASAAAAQSASVLLQEGLHAEQIKGDLDAAIEIYERVLKGFPKNRPVAARALLRIGLCYEKLGKQEAQKAYQRLIKEFADQPEAVSAAQTRLAALGQQESDQGPILRRVYSGYLGYPGNLTGDLAVRDLTSGEVRRLTNKGSWSESNAFADQSIFSPDDKQIAYVWYTHEGEAQLRILSTDGNGQRVLYPRNEENKKDGAFLWPIDWSPNGEHILCTWQRKGHKNRVMLLSVEDSSLRELELPEHEEGKPISDFSSAKFSPDGRHLTLDARAAKDAGRDVFLLSLEDGSRTPLIEHPADDYLLGWSPDSNHLVFASDRTGDPGIWVLRMEQGKPVGNPLLVKTQMGNFGRVGMMHDGAYYFTTGSGERRNVFTAGLDPETGKITTVSKGLLPDAKLSRSMADWLGGADEIAYLEWGDEGGIKIRKIMIHSLDNNTTRELVTNPRIKGYNINSLAVCPTGKWLAVWGYIEDTLKWRVLLIDLDTNELTEVKQPGNFVNVRWSKDGRWLYFGGFLPDENRSALFRRDMQTGEVTELFEPPSSFFSWTISPDGKQIAYSDSQTGEIKVIPVTGGEPRVVAKVQNMTKMQQGSGAWLSKVASRKQSQSAPEPECPASGTCRFIRTGNASSLADSVTQANTNCGPWRTSCRNRRSLPD
jgi:Tol biopolymer transport system component